MKRRKFEPGIPSANSYFTSHWYEALSPQERAQLEAEQQAQRDKFFKTEQQRFNETPDA